MPWGWAVLAAVAATSALSQYQSGKAEAKSMSAQADIYHQQAQRRREIAAVEETRKRSQLSRLQGLQRARLGAAGVAPESGSALLLQAETARDSELEALLLRAQGQNEAASIGHQGDLTRWAARERRKAADRDLLIGMGKSASYAYGGFAEGAGGASSAPYKYPRPSAAENRYGSTLGSGGFPTLGYDYYGS